MTLINAKIYDSGGEPLTGFIRVTLDYRINTDDGESYEPVYRDYTLIDGLVSIELEPSDLAKVTYKFEVYKRVTVDLVVTDTLIDSFNAVVPGSITPILFTDLARTTGIVKDDMDASLYAVVRRLLASSTFWIGVTQNIFKAKGAYSPTSWYSIGDIVNYNGNGYINISLVATQGVSPNPSGDNTTWKLLVSKGATGAGTTGDSTAYDPLVWVDDVAPARSAVKDKIETLATQDALAAAFVNTVLSGSPTVSGSIPSNDNSARIASTQWVQDLLSAAITQAIPIGLMTYSYGGSSPPAKWLPCNGSVYSRTTYSALFAVIGTTFNTGGELSTQFRVPNISNPPFTVAIYAGV